MPMAGHIHRTIMAWFTEKNLVALIGFYGVIYGNKVSLPL